MPEPVRAFCTAREVTFKTMRRVMRTGERGLEAGEVSSGDGRRGATTRDVLADAGHRAFDDGECAARTSKVLPDASQCGFDPRAGNTAFPSIFKRFQLLEAGDARRFHSQFGVYCQTSKINNN